MVYKFHVFMHLKKISTDESNILADLEVTAVEHSLIFHRPHWLSHKLKDESQGVTFLFYLS